jgi:hypothetical protein
MPILAVLVLGCVENASKTNDPTSPPDQIGVRATGERRDAVPEPKLLVEMFVYKLRVPVRAVSHNEVFWRHVDEQNLDVSTHDLLLMNGFRVGLAPREDWDYFRQILEQQDLMSRLTGASSVTATQIDMPLKQNVPEAFVAYFHPAKGLVAQIYDQCDISMLINFASAPRNPGTVRVAVTPKFLSQRTRIGYTSLNEPMPELFVRPEYLFDLRLQLDIPLDHFLLIGPSTDADNPATLGHKLLDQEVNGQEFETVLLLAPQPFQFDKPATQPTTKASPFAVQ